MTDLRLALKSEYFEAIRHGTKTEEYRLDNPYWQKRLVGRTFDRLVLTSGYPANGDCDRIMVLPWRGWVRQTITHPHFGEEPVAVFAILLTGDQVQLGKVDVAAAMLNATFAASL